MPVDAKQLGFNERLVGRECIEDTQPTHHRGARLDYLDGWRGLSITMVLIGHLVPHAEPIAKAGVQMFFALSGRLMADILFVQQLPLAAFYKRRFSRIYPALLLFVLGAYALVAYTQISFKPVAAAISLALGLNYALVLGHGVPAIENIWSLCVEEHSLTEATEVIAVSVAPG